LEGRVAIAEFGGLKLFDAEGVQLWEVNLPEPTSEANAWLARAPLQFARSLDSLVADDHGNFFCQEQSGFVHAYSVEGKHRWSYWAAGGRAYDDGLQPPAGGSWVLPFNDWHMITNRTSNPLTGPIDYFSKAQGLICLNDRGEELWRCKLSGGLTLERPKNAFEWRAAWARRFGWRESLHFKPPLIAPDGTIYQIAASGRGKSWVYALRGD
jgi:outer membrane protein assembly factor BamB